MNGVNLYIFVSIITFICLLIWYVYRDYDYLEEPEDYCILLIEVVIESMLWVISIPLLIILGIIDSIDMIIESKGE